MQKSSYSEWEEMFDQDLESFKQRKEQETIKDLMDWDVEEIIEEPSETPLEKDTVTEGVQGILYLIGGIWILYSVLF